VLAGRDHGAKDFFRRRFDPGPPLHGQVRRILRQVHACAQAVPAGQSKTPDKVITNALFIV